VKKNKHKPVTRHNRGVSVSIQDKFYAFLHIHAHALFSSLGRLVRTPFTSAMTLLVLALAIALAGSFYILVVNVQQITGDLQSSNRISLFLKLEVTPKQAQKLAQNLKKNTVFQEIKLISKDQAMEEFKAYSGFGEALNALQDNPLPIVIQILPKPARLDQVGLTQLIDQLENLPEADFAQLDMQWVKRLQALMAIARTGVILVSLLLAFAVLFIIGNTIRLELQNRSDEVQISKLVGATDVFIRRPFLYSGFWVGFFAALIAWIIITLILLVINQPVAKLFALYDVTYQIIYLRFSEIIMMCFLSSALGILGAWSVLRYQLQQIRPE